MNTYFFEAILHWSSRGSKIITSLALLICLLLSSLHLNAEDDLLGDFYPGKITICFSAELIGNTVGDFDITQRDGIIYTPFDWFNELSKQYEIIDLKQNYRVKYREWHLDGRYPMNVFTISIKDDTRTDELIKNLETQKDILFAERKAIDRVSYTPNDPQIIYQWALNTIQAFDAWDIQPGGSSDVIIGIVDTGIKWNHPDLAANMWINEAELPGISINWETGEIRGGDYIDNDGNGFIDDVLGWDFYANSPNTPNNNPFQNLNGSPHGTRVAGCAAAVGDNRRGVAGPAYNVKILATKHAPYNIYTNSITNGYNGIYYMVDTGAHIINTSWGGSGNSNTANLAASYAKSHGSLLVTSAGNNNRDSIISINYPAGATDAFSVIATDRNDQKASFSNFGLLYDISAPGVLVRSTSFDTSGNNIYLNVGGTSMASPTVAGVAALIKSQDIGMTVDDLISYIKDGADSIDHLNPDYVNMLGAGRINANNSVRLVSLYDFDLAATSISGIYGAHLNTTITFAIAVRNRGFETASGYTIHLMKIGETIPLASISGDILSPGVIQTYHFEWTPTIPGDTQLYGEIIWGLDENLGNNQTSIHQLTIYPEGTIYLENFNSTTNMTALRWNGTLDTEFSGIHPGSGVEHSNALVIDVSRTTSQNIYTPLIGPLSAGSNVSFAYRIVDYTGNWGGAQTPVTLQPPQTIIIEISTTGPTGPYTPIRQIDDTNHTPSINFTTINFSLADFENRSITMRFSVRNQSTYRSWSFVLDDVIVTNVDVPIFHSPRNLYAIATNQQVQLSWLQPEAGSSSTHIGYNIYRNTFPLYTPSLATLIQTINDINTVIWIDSNLINETEYYYTMTAIYSNPASESIPIHASQYPVVPHQDLSPQRPSNWGTNGAGTETNPFLISNLANLRWLSEVSDDWWIDGNTLVHFLQTADIDATETMFWNNGAGFKPIGHNPAATLGYVIDSFVGIYDGNNYRIYNLSILRGSIATGNAGLFDCIHFRSHIKNVRLYDSRIIGNYFVGGIVGSAFNSTISNSYITGEVMNELGFLRARMGGISGYISNSTISNCYFSGDISDVHHFTDGYIGGLIGYMLSSSISNSYSAGSISFNRLYNSGSVGGISGGYNNRQISRCYFSGEIISESAFRSGGIIGMSSYYGSISNSLWDIERSGSPHATSSSTPSTNIGLNTYEMKRVINYTDRGWDFDEIWSMTPHLNYGYPFLQSLPDVPVSYPPQNLVYILEDDTVNLSWDSPNLGSTGSFERYHVYRNYLLIGNTITTTYSDVGLEQNQEYDYYVTAVYSDPNGETIASNNITVIFPPELTTDPTSHDFADGIVGETSPIKVFSITNTGGTPLRVNSISILGDNASEFNLINESGVLGLYMPEESRNFGISFSPISPGSKTAYIEITDDIEETIFPLQSINEPKQISMKSNHIANAINRNRTIHILELSGNAIDTTDNEDDIELLVTKLHGSHPNPFNPETTIKFSIGSPPSMRWDTASPPSVRGDTTSPPSVRGDKGGVSVRIDIYNIKGQRVTTLADGIYTPGIHNIIWKGVDENNNPVSSGIYFYRMQTDEYSSVKRMMLVK